MARRARAVALASSVLLGCTGFDLLGAEDAASPRDAHTASSGRHDATLGEAHPDAHASVDAADGSHRPLDADASPDGGSLPCVSWATPLAGAPCEARQILRAILHVGDVHILHLSRAFGTRVALLYDAPLDAGQGLVLALLDPTTGAVLESRTIATANDFDSAALAFDAARGLLSVAYHAGGDALRYVAMDAGLVAGAPEVVVAEAGPSQLAMASIASGIVDAGPLGTVHGSVGLAWFPSPAEPDVFSTSFIYLLARSARGWSEAQIYGYAPVRSDLQIADNAQGGVTASALAYSPLPAEPYEPCTWQMAAHANNCFSTGNTFGTSLALGPDAARLAFTHADPGTGVTTLDIATDTDGSYSFPLLSTITTYPAAVQQGIAEPKMALFGSTVAVAVVYPTRSLPYRVDFSTWDTGTGAVTTEGVESVSSSSAKAPAMDLVIDASGNALLAFADPDDQSIVLARATLTRAGDAGLDAD